MNFIVYNIIKNFVNATYNKIEVNSGNCRFNQRCHLNSVHEALNNNEEKIPNSIGELTLMESSGCTLEEVRREDMA